MVGAEGSRRGRVMSGKMLVGGGGGAVVVGGASGMSVCGAAVAAAAVGEMCLVRCGGLGGRWRFLRGVALG